MPFLILTLSLWGIGAVISVLVGITNQTINPESCSGPLSRVEYVVPTYRLGCWLGEKPSQDVPTTSDSCQNVQVGYCCVTKEFANGRK